MNGGNPKIEIFKPFGEAFELTKKILFQPFDLSKWLVIGFAAFLAGHFAGAGFNFPSSFGNFQPLRAKPNLNLPDLEHWKPWLHVAIAFFALLIFAFIILITWLKARGTFIFTDCIVRNRAAIVEPWHEYRKEGNSYFLFLLAIAIGAVGLAAIMLAIFIALGWLRHGAGETNAITSVVLLVFLFVFWFSIAIFIALVSYFTAPVMYRRRCRAREAFRDVTRLIARNLVPFVLFCLFSIVLFLAVLMIGGIVSCATCCLAVLPYVGTVILLPLFVCLRAFGLLFLRQFGPDYDVWAGLSQPPPPPAPPLPPSFPS